MIFEESFVKLNTTKILKIVRLIVQKLYQIWTIFNFTWLMLFSVPLIVLLIILNEKQGGEMANRVLKFWGRGFCALSGIFYKTIGKEKLVPNTPYIFTANHRSFLDSPAMVHAIPNQFRALGKKEILKYPVFGFLFRYIGVTVDRSSLRNRKESLDSIRKKLDKQMHILIFPEGRMNMTSNPLLRFYDGAFRLAIEAQTPVVPTAILNSRTIMPRKKFRLKTGVITVQFGDPIPTKGMTIAQTKELKTKVYTEIERMILEFEQSPEKLSNRKPLD